MTSGLGSMTITGESNLTIDFSSQGATSGLSGVGVNAQAVATLPSLNTSVGSVGVTVTGVANLTPASQLATSALGTITQRSSNTIVISGFGLTSGLGTITEIAKANVTLIGFEATSELSSVLVWSMLEESQASGFNEITDTQTPGWSEVSDSETASWEDVA